MIFTFNFIHKNQNAFNCLPSIVRITVKCNNDDLVDFLEWAYYNTWSTNTFRQQPNLIEMRLCMS